MRSMKFFWAAAIALSLWDLLVEPMFAERVTVTCYSAAPMEFAPPGLPAVAAEFAGALLTLAEPLLLALFAVWAIRSRALLPAALGLAFALLPAALTWVGELLSPEQPFIYRECLAEQLPTPSFVVPRLILAWVLSPATMVVLAGIAGTQIRPRLTDLRNAGIAAAAVVLAVLLPGVLIGLPGNDDGTPRYAIAGGWGQPYVLDLESGEPVSRLPRATPTFAGIEFIVRDTEPGRYVAAFSSPTGGYFRLYRLAMGADGRITVGERLTPTIKGSINGLAVSPEGRIAYGRDNVVGTLEREWPGTGYGLQWLDTRTLALPSHSVPVKTLATLDVGTGAIRNVPAPAAHEFTRPLLALPDGRQVRALGWPTRTIVVHEGTRLVRTVLALGCGHIESMAVATTGRHLLVGVDRKAEEMDRTPLAGLPPCDGAESQLLRIDLESGDTQVVPGEQEPWAHAW